MTGPEKEKAEVNLKQIESVKEFNAVVCTKCHKVHGANKKCKEIVIEEFNLELNNYIKSISDTYMQLGLSETDIDDIFILIKTVQRRCNAVIATSNLLLREDEALYIKDWFLELEKTQPKSITHSEWHLAEKIYKWLGLKLPDSISTKVR